MYSSDSSSEDEQKTDRWEFWNNWEPCTHKSDSPSNTSSSAKTSKTSIVYPTNNTCASVSTAIVNKKFGNWIPPLSFSVGNEDLTTKRITIHRVQQQRKSFKKATNSTDNGEETKSRKRGLDIFEEPCDQIFEGQLKLNSDWGVRVELHDVTAYNDGNVIWGIVNPGMFAHIKLWINEYGHICGSGDGTISKKGSSEETFITITGTQLLRKMLNVSNSNWVSLCEAVEQTKTTLNFEASKEFEPTEKSSLEKLWYFLCKRRHFLPDQCMLVKLNGAIKRLREFKITSKLVVLDIRDIQGQPII